MCDLVIKDTTKAFVNSSCLLLFYFATFCKLVKYNYTIYTTLSGHVLLYVWNCKKLSNIITENWKLDTKQFTMSISRTECRNRYKDVEVNSFQLIRWNLCSFSQIGEKKFVTAAASGLAFPNIRLKMYYPVLQYRYLHLFY